METPLDPVEELMAACLEKPAQEWTAALEEACAEHPEHADELRERMSLVAALDETRQSGRVPKRLGDFELLERIGGGGMGVVYRALQTSLGREVAVKIVRPEQLWFENARRRFARETEAIAKLSHPSILRIHTVGEDEGLPFFAMELLEGATLAEVLRRVAGRAPEGLTGRDLLEAVCGHERPPTDVPEVFRGGWVEACLALTAQVARALAHAHRLEVLHRDVKPSNVMLGPDGRAVLLDFGLTSSAGADRVDRVTRSGSPVGTLVYMSPEQVDGQELDVRTDVYSLGVTLYELLTLQVPFLGQNTLEIQSAILAGAVDDIRARNRRVSEDAQTVCLKAMERGRGDRYADARAFADDLERVLDRRPIVARPPGLGRRGVRWVQRNPTLAVALILGVLAFGGIPFAMWRVERSNAAEVTKSLEAERLAKLGAQEAKKVAEDALEAEREALNEAEQQRQEALTARNEAVDKEGEAMEMLTFLDGVFKSVKVLEGGRIPDAREMLEAAAARIQSLEGYPRGRMTMTLGVAYYNLALYTEAIPLLEVAAHYFEQWSSPGGDEQLAYTLYHLGRARGFTGDYEAAIADMRSALELAKRVQDPTGKNLAFYYFELAETLESLQRPECVEVRRNYIEYLKTYRPDDELALAKAESALGHSLLAYGEPIEGEALMKASLERMRELCEPLDTDLIQATLRFGNVAKVNGDFDRARELFEEGLDKTLTRWGELGEPNLRFAAESALAAIEMDLRNWEAAAERFESFLPQMRQALPRGNQTLTSTLLSYGNALGRAGRHADVIRLWVEEDAITDFRRLYKDSSYTTTAYQTLVTAYMALEDWRSAIGFLEQIVQALPDVPCNRTHRALAQMTIGQVYVNELGEADEARAALEKLLAIVGDEPCMLQKVAGRPAEEVGTTALEMLVELATENGWDELAAWETALADRRESLGD